MANSVLGPDVSAPLTGGFRKRVPIETFASLASVVNYQKMYTRPKENGGGTQMTYMETTFVKTASVLSCLYKFQNGARTFTGFWCTIILTLAYAAVFCMILRRSHQLPACRNHTLHRRAIGTGTQIFLCTFFRCVLKRKEINKPNLPR